MLQVLMVTSASITHHLRIFLRRTMTALSKRDAVMPADEQQLMDLCEYRVGLNLFNKGPPEMGIQYLINKGFINLKKKSSLPAAVAHFLIVRQGLSKQRITEYLLDHRKQFNMMVLDQFMWEQNFSGYRMDRALRRMLSRVRIPNFAQAALLLRAFADRYVACNPSLDGSSEDSGLNLLGSTPGSAVHGMGKVDKPRLPVKFAKGKHTELIPYLTKDEVYVITCELLVYNDCIHSQAPPTSLNLSSFLLSLSEKLNFNFPHENYLIQMYDSMKQEPMKQGVDHTEHLAEIQTRIRLGPSKDTLLLNTPSNMDRQFVLRHPVCMGLPVIRNGVLQYDRELFIFNDAIIITKPIPGSVNKYTFCSVIILSGLDVVKASDNMSGHIGVNLVRDTDSHVLISLTARNEEDRDRIFKHLRESIIENKLTCHEFRTMTNKG